MDSPYEDHKLSRGAGGGLGASPIPSPRELTFRLDRSPTRFLLQNFPSVIQKGV